MSTYGMKRIHASWIAGMHKKPHCEGAGEDTSSFVLCSLHKSDGSKMYGWVYRQSIGECDKILGKRLLEMEALSGVWDKRSGGRTCKFPTTNEGAFVVVQADDEPNCAISACKSPDLTSPSECMRRIIKLEERILALEQTVRTSVVIVDEFKVFSTANVTDDPDDLETLAERFLTQRSPQRSPQCSSQRSPQCSAQCSKQCSPQCYPQCSPQWSHHSDPQAWNLMALVHEASGSLVFDTASRDSSFVVHDQTT